LALLSAACGSTAEAGLRGTGTVLFPREANSMPTSMPSSEPTVAAQAPPRTLIPTPTPRVDPIVPADALPTVATGSSDAEMHVIPPLADKLRMSPTQPAKRVIIPTLGLDSKVIQLGTKLDRHGNIAWET